MGRVHPIRKETTHMFFPKPEVIEMEGIKPAVNDSKDSKGVSIISNCRLRSSYGQGMYQLPKEIEYALEERASYHEIVNYLRENEIKGYGEGAVVARRYASSYRWKFPSQWGVIMLSRKHTTSNFPYAPYMVKWFDEKAPQDEPAWAEDLIVIHACIDEAYLRDIVESQGVVMDDA